MAFRKVKYGSVRSLDEGFADVCFDKPLEATYSGERYVVRSICVPVKDINRNGSSVEVRGRVKFIKGASLERYLANLFEGKLKGDFEEVPDTSDKIKFS